MIPNTLHGVEVRLVEVGHKVQIGTESETVTEDECVLLRNVLYCTQAQFDLIKQEARK